MKFIIHTNRSSKTEIDILKIYVISEFDSNFFNTKFFQFLNINFLRLFLRTRQSHLHPIMNNINILLITLTTNR